MLVIPAIDILGGRCVRLLQGDFHHATVYSDDPLETALRHASAGAARIHVVDLDAARGGGDNREVIGAILKRGEIHVQVAGGVRSPSIARSLLEAGARFVVMGTAAARDPRALERTARANPGQVLVALDVRGGSPAAGGWLETVEHTTAALVERWNKLPLAGIILTCIDRDGTMAGPDLETLRSVRAMTELELQYSGGISELADISAVEAAGAQAVIFGKALYEGRIRLEDALAL